MKKFDEEKMEEMVAKALKEEIESSSDVNRTYKPLEDVPKAQLIVNRRLILEIKELEESLDRHRKISLIMSGAMIFLSVILVILGGVETYHLLLG